MEERQISRQHRLILSDRALLTINGVLDILSFDIHQVLLETEQGMLMIKGKNLHVNRLTLEKGEVDLAGRIDSLVYSELQDKHRGQSSFLGRLFGLPQDEGPGPASKRHR